MIDQHGRNLIGEKLMRKSGYRRHTIRSRALSIFILAIASILSLASTNAAKPKVWIYTDMSDDRLPGPNKENTINDPDDISAMAGYLLMANQFETLGIVITSTHRDQHKTTPHQGDWANEFIRSAYLNDLPNLNATIGGYPEDIRFRQSGIKESGERFDPKRSYKSLSGYPTVKALFDTAEQETDLINVLCWGSVTEPAILVQHCLQTGRRDLLQRLRFIAHWTNSSLRQGSPEHPENVANCREDAKACAFLKTVALNGSINYYECGAIGQAGIVSGSPKGWEYFDAFRTSQLGTLFVEGKFANDCVDHSDAATYWTLLGNWGVSLDDIASNGTNFPEVEQANEDAFRAWSPRIHDELLRRSRIAGGDAISQKE